MSKLGQYCIIRSLLFKGEEVKTNTESSELKEKEEMEQKNKKTPKKKGRCR